MTKTIRVHGLRGDLCASTADGAAFSVMVGVGETYLPAFVLAVGLGEVLAGLTATIPMLAGAALQLLAPRLMRHAGSHRRWVIFCATLQAASFLPLTVAAVVGRISWFAVLLVATVYWAAGMATSPAWNTWMSRAVPRSLRARFFARRTRIAQMAVLFGLLVGGMTLHLASARGLPVWGFAILFGTACGSRLVSACFLARQQEPRSPVPVDQRVSLAAFAGRLGRPEGRLLAYMLAAQTTTHLAAPYFNPFMLGELKLHYPTYMLLLGTAFLAKAIALPKMGRWAHRFGPKSLLWIGGIGIVPLPALWLLSTATVYLLTLQIVGGVVWACYEFATFLLLFETIRDDERTSVLTSFNLLNAVAIAAGSAAGGLLLGLAGEGRDAYMFLFLASSAGRLFTLPLLRTVAEAPRIPFRMGFRPLAVRPSAGSVDRPILATMQGATNEKDAETVQDLEETAT
ncbi:MAG: MFS transporter [Phycisphaerae bacterium]